MPQLSDRITIGELATRTRLSLKALRLYGERGLLPPARVDPRTGVVTTIASGLPPLLPGVGIGGAGMSGLALTKLDVLSGLDPLRVAVRYRGPEGATFDEFPYHQSILHKAGGDLVELPGWHEDIRGCRSIEELPQNAQAYLDYISDFLGIPIVMVGVGPGPDEDQSKEEPVIPDGAGSGRHFRSLRRSLSDP
jgi:hypothetical protein